MKKITTVLLMLLISMCFILSGCGAPLKMPNNYTKVVSNGGFVVGAGDYAYVANAYQSYSNLTKKADNTGKGVAQYSINRTQLDVENPNQSYFNYLKTEDGTAKFELVLNKIAGYETSNMYVVGEYLYFTTPNVHKNKQNAYEFNLSTLFRVKLNGTDLKEIYTTKSSDAKFYLTGNENKQLLIFDDETIKVLDVYKKSTSVKNLIKDDVKVSEVVFPATEEQEVTYLYFTAEKENTLISGNRLCQLNITTGHVENEKVLANNTFKILTYNFGTVFFVVTGNTESDGLYSATAETFTTGGTRHRYATDTTSLVYLKDAEYNVDCFVFIYNNNPYIQLMTQTNDNQAVKLNDNSATLQFVDGTYVYYSTSEGIYKISVIEREALQISNMTEFDSKKMDFDGRYVYFFAKGEGQETETKYLYRADTFITEEDEIKTECFSKLLEKDIPEEEDEEE